MKADATPQWNGEGQRTAYRIAWTAGEDEHLLRLRLAGYSHVDIGLSVARPRSTVGTRIRTLIDAMPEPMRGPYNEPPVARSLPAAPLLDDAMRSPMVSVWSDELDKRLLELREKGWSFARIGKSFGFGHSTANARWLKLTATMPRPKEKKVEPVSTARPHYSGIRPPGPMPKNPAPPKSPLDAGWRKCLGHECGKHFWSFSASHRRCPECTCRLRKGDVMHDCGEFSLHL